MSKFKVGDRVRIKDVNAFYGLDADFEAEYSGNIGTVFNVDLGDIPLYDITFDGITKGWGVKNGRIIHDGGSYQSVDERNLELVAGDIYCTCKKCPCCGKIVKEQE